MAPMSKKPLCWNAALLPSAIVAVVFVLGAVMFWLLVTAAPCHKSQYGYFVRWPRGPVCHCGPPVETKLLFRLSANGPALYRISPRPVLLAPPAQVNATETKGTSP